MEKFLAVVGLITICVCLLLIISGSVYAIRQHLHYRRIASEARAARFFKAS